jgi:hypothetical protein
MGEPLRSVGSGDCGAAAGRPGCQVVFTAAAEPGGWTVLTTLSGVPCCDHVKASLMVVKVLASRSAMRVAPSPGW